MAGNRQLIEASIDISATPAQVWQVVGDLARMGRRSPQCRRMFILGKPVGRGTRTVNINQSGWKWWPTTSRIIEFEPERVLTFTVPINGSVWSYELEPIDNHQATRLTESRRLNTAASGLSNFLADRMLGGIAAFEDELERGMNRTLEAIKTEAEAAA